MMAVQLAFDYDVLAPPVADRMRVRAERIHHASRRAALDIIQIGQDLTDAKSDLDYGLFRAWLRKEFDWSIQSAYNYMRVYDLVRCKTVVHLTSWQVDVSALYLIASPKVPKPIKAELLELADSGVEITKRVAVIELEKRGVKVAGKKRRKRQKPYAAKPPKADEFARDVRICAPIAEAVDALAHCMEPPPRMWDGLARIHADSFLQDLEDAIQYLVRLQRERPNAAKRPAIVSLSR